MENDVAMNKDLKKEKKKINKGDYGYARKNKNTKLILTLGLFLCILVDVVLALIIYQTRNTLLTIIACVMSLPFAKMLIGYFMCLRFKPLSKAEYEKTEEVAKANNVKFLYDINISKSEGIMFFPCILVYNNNVIAYVPDASSNDKNHKYTEYLKMSYEGLKFKYRVLVVSSLDRLDREIKKINEPSEDDKKVDRYIAKHLIELTY